MTQEHIRQSIEAVTTYYGEHPDKAQSTDRAATAVVEAGLRCRVSGPRGETLVSDMPKGIGGAASAPTPGWLLRAALAACDATVITMRAAQLGITLSKLEVTVDSVSDDRGILGLGDGVPAGPLSVRLRVLIGADAAPAERLREIVAWAEHHSPVGDAIRRAVPSHVEIDIA